MPQKLATPPKPYTPKELSTEVLVPMIGNEGKTYSLSQKDEVL